MICFLSQNIPTQSWILPTYRSRHLSILNNSHLDRKAFNPPLFCTEFNAQEPFFCVITLIATTRHVGYLTNGVAVAVILMMKISSRCTINRWIAERNMFSVCITFCVSSLTFLYDLGIFISIWSLNIMAKITPAAAERHYLTVTWAFTAFKLMMVINLLPALYDAKLSIILVPNKNTVLSSIELLYYRSWKCSVLTNWSSFATVNKYLVHSTFDLGCAVGVSIKFLISLDMYIAV